MLRAYKTTIFAKGQKLTHSPAHEEKHAGQETPLHYTPYLQWHHPGGRALLQLAQAPTQDWLSYTHTLLGVVEEHVVGLIDPPVKKTREHSAAKQLWPNRGRHDVFPLLELGGKGCSCCVHSVDVDGVELPSPLLAEVQSIVFVISALVWQGKKKMACCCTNHPTCPAVKQRPMKRCLRRRDQATLHVLYASQCDL